MVANLTYLELETPEGGRKVPATVEILDSVVVQAATQHGLSVQYTDDPAALELRGGDQAEFRVKGGWWAKPNVFPKKGVVRRVAADGGYDVEIEMQETMGFGLMDPWTKRKYRAALEAILDEFDAALASLGGAAV